MTAPGARAGSPGGRRVWPWLVLVAGLLVVAAVAGAPDQSSGEPFDPSSTSATGTKALVELIEGFGAQVDSSAVLPADGTDVAVMFTDSLDEADTSRLERWVEQGGTLVVADPFSSFVPTVAAPMGAFGVAPNVDRGQCDIAALADLAVVDPGEGVTYDVGATDRSCFGDGATAFVVASDVGQGEVVAVGGGAVFTNAVLDHADDAALASRLLVPEPGTRVAVLAPGTGEGSSDRSLTDVLAPGVRFGLAELVVAFVVYAWFRARRLGKPVVESQPVEIAGSELVLAVGQLLQQTKHPAPAADLLRVDARRRIGERLGLAPGADPEIVADAVAARTGRDGAQLRRLLAPGPVADDAALVQLAQDLRALRQEIDHEH